MARPDEVECIACGGTAARVMVGTTTWANYRCGRCRSGGVIGSDGIANGPVFTGFVKRVRAGP